MESQQDFFEGLKTEDEKREEWSAAAEAMIRFKEPVSAPVEQPIEKQAGVVDRALAHGGAELQHLAKPSTLAALGIGAAAGGGMTYLGNRPRKDTGKGATEEAFESAVKHHHEKPETTFRGKMSGRSTEFMHGMAKAMREHPVQGTIAGAGTGAGIGLLASHLLRRK